MKCCTSPTAFVSTQELRLLFRQFSLVLKILIFFHFLKITDCCVNNVRVVFTGGDDLTPRIDDGRVTPSLVFGVWVSSGRDSGHVKLVI